MSDQLPPPPAPGTGDWRQVGPYATSTVVVAPMRSLRGLSIALLVLFVLVALVDVVGAAALFNRAELMDDLLTSDPPSFSEGEDADDAVAGAVVVHILLMVTLAVVFIIWQWRHAKNAETLGSKGGLGPGWAIGGWFIPLANFVLPGVQLFQSSRASDLQARSQGRRGKGAGVVIAWAIVFGLAVLLLRGSDNLGDTDDEGNLVFDTVDDIESAADGDRLGGAGFIVMIPAAALGAVMVWTLSKRQKEAYAAMAAATNAALSAPSASPSQARWPGEPVADWSQPSDQPGPPLPPTVVPPAPSTSGPEGWGTAPGADSPASSVPPPPSPVGAGATPPPAPAPPATPGSSIPPPPGAPAEFVGSPALPVVPPPPAPPPKPDAGAPAAPPAAPPPAASLGQDPASATTEPGLDPGSSVDEEPPDASGPEDAPPSPGASDDQPGWAAPSAPATETPPPPPPS